ncbi:hypothetical protein H4S04_000649 [Coemansia sp. S16]|nr:hypothetical protein H4S04_000649 [Coemansia sp. S16]
MWPACTLRRVRSWIAASTPQGLTTLPSWLRIEGIPVPKINLWPIGGGLTLRRPHSAQCNIDDIYVDDTSDCPSEHKNHHCIVEEDNASWTPESKHMVVVLDKEEGRPLMSVFQVPAYMVEDYIWDKYRPLCFSYKECLKSWGYVHSELGNIMTHLAGVLVFIVLALVTGPWIMPYISRSRPEGAPAVGYADYIIVYVYLTAVLFCLAASVAFHTLACHSQCKHFRSLRCDFIGILTLIVGSFVPVGYFGFLHWNKMLIGYMAMFVAIGIAGIAVSVWGKVEDPRRAGWRPIIFFTIAITGLVPIIHGAVVNGFSGAVNQMSLWYVVGMGVMYVAGTMIYAFKIPERYRPVDPGMFTPAPERNIPKRAPKRSVAYTIPLPDTQVPSPIEDDIQRQGHVLGVNALALSFQPVGFNTDAGGILFSGGRDGVVKAWDLNFPLCAKPDGGPWTIDRQRVRHTRPGRTSLRASQVVHSDWVNDIVVVNGGETVVSASSDQTVRAWSPHRADERPQAVGSHLDYVKALAYSEHRRMVISGGLDRKIKLWDLAQGGLVASLQEFGDASVSSSVYTLACNMQGSLVVSGSPEKLIRVWDTRAGRQLTTLSGHTDHIRAVLLSADSELVLSGSSDSTVKLWSMRMRRCLSTFTQHSDSVWALYSTHPKFRTFYSASRDGLVAKTVGAGSFGEEATPSARRTSFASRPAADDTQSGVVCVAVAKEQQGVVKIVAADDTYIWTATKGTMLNRWLDVSVRPRGASLASQSSHPATPVLTSVAQLANHGFGHVGALGSSAGAVTNEVTQQSLMVPQQSGVHTTMGNSATGHRRNRTVDHSTAGTFTHSAVHPVPNASNAISPVLKAIQAEQARRNAFKEVEEDHFYDAHSAGSIDSAAASSRRSRSRSLSAGSGSNGAVATARQLGSITTVLATDSNEQYLVGSEAEALYIPESPLPSQCLMKANQEAVTSVAASSTQLIQAAMTGSSSDTIPVRSEPDETIYGRHGLHRHKILDNKRQVLAQDTRGRVSLWDIMLCQRIYEFPETKAEAEESPYPGVFGTDFDAIQMAVSGEPESVSSWCHVDTRVGMLTVHLDESWVWNAEVHIDEVEGVADDAVAAMGDHERVNIGQWMLKRLFLAYTRNRVRRGPLSRHDAALLNRWVTQIPAGSVVPAKPPSQGPIPYSAAPAGTFATLGHESSLSSSAPAMTRAATARLPTLTSPRPTAQPAPSLSPTERVPSIASQLLATAHELGLGSEARLQEEKGAENESTRDNGTAAANMPDGGKSATLSNKTPLPHIPQPVGSPGHHHSPSIVTAANSASATTAQQLQQSPQTQQLKGDDGESANSTGSTGKFMNRLLSMRVRRQKSTLVATSNGSSVPVPTLPNIPVSAAASGGDVPIPPSNNRSTTAPGGLAQTDAMPTAPSAPVSAPLAARDDFAEWAGPRYPTDTERTLGLLQHMAAPWEQLYSPVLCPRLALPRNIVVQVFQEHFEASEPFSIYRNTVEAMSGTNDAPSLAIFRIIDDPLLSFELCMPVWLADFLLFNRLPAAYQEPVKIPFVLSPAKGATLPPLPNPGARLVASRMLRARKLAIYVVDKLELPLLAQPAPNYVNAVDVCVRVYRKMEEARASAPSYTVAELFAAAGETLSEEERVALADVTAWQESVRRAAAERAGSVESGGTVERAAEYSGRPELYLDLFCKDKQVFPKYTLATIKTTAWKASSDIQVNYDWAEFVKRRVAKAQMLVASNSSA